MDTVGIYIIYFDTPNKCYIGQSIRVETRLRKHREMLQSNSHYNYKLQEGYNTSTQKVFELLEKCNPSELNSKEILYINEFNSLVEGYNLIAGGDVPIGHSSSRSKYTREQLVYIYKLLSDESLTNIDVSEKAGVPIKIVETLSCGSRHIWLQEEFPELYKKIRTIVDNKVRSSLCNDYNARNGVIYSVIDPNNKEWQFSNISRFAEEHKLNRSHLNQLILGKEKQHKGWRKGVQYVI